MEEIKIDWKKIESDTKNMKQLSEEELEAVSGGLQSIESLNFFSWHCKTCYTEGPTSLALDSAFNDSKVAHKAATGHCVFTILSAKYREGVGYCCNGAWTEIV